jgi:hypothetical protein
MRSATKVTHLLVRGTGTLYGVAVGDDEMGKGTPSWRMKKMPGDKTAAGRFVDLFERRGRRVGEKVHTLESGMQGKTQSLDERARDGALTGLNDVMGGAPGPPVI